MRSPDVKFRDVSSDYGKLELSWWVFLSDKIITFITTSISIITIIIFSWLGMWTQMRTLGTSESSFRTVQELCWSKTLAMPTGDHSYHDIIVLCQITCHDISILASQNRISGKHSLAAKGMCHHFWSPPCICFCVEMFQSPCKFRLGSSYHQQFKPGPNVSDFHTQTQRANI